MPGRPPQERGAMGRRHRRRARRRSSHTWCRDLAGSNAEIPAAAFARPRSESHFPPLSGRRRDNRTFSGSRIRMASPHAFLTLQAIRLPTLARAARRRGMKEKPLRDCYLVVLILWFRYFWCVSLWNEPLVLALPAQPIER